MKQYLHETRQTIVLSLPFIANQLLQISVTTVDNLMAGADGDLTLAAVSQGSAIWFIVLLMLIGLMMAVSPMIARVHTNNNDARTRELFQQSVWLALFMGILAIPLILLSPNIMIWVGVKPAIIEEATAYLNTMAIGLPFLALYLPVRFFNEGIANPKAIMYITALTIPINVVGNYVFLNGLFGLPKMGTTGIALASVISIIANLLLGWWYLLKSQRMQSFGLLQNFSRPILSDLKRFVRLGGPNAIALAMESGMFTCVALLSGRLGIAEAAANQIAFNYIAVVFMVPLGLSMAMMTRVGMAMGNDNLPQARIIGISGIVLGAAFMLLSVIFIFFIGDSIATLYSDSEEVISITVGLLTLAAIFQIPDAIQVCSSGALRGLEETQAPMRYAILGYWVLGVPLAILLAFYAKLSAQGLWVGLLAGLSVTAVLCTRKFLQCSS